ncbi:MAG TPA: C40 family peptidase [Burkholderiaceae bacterium]|nr:C40 family peptidase [Burkholderiaceae bacterium]
MRIGRMLCLSLVVGFASGCASSRDPSPSEQRVLERAAQVALSMVGKPYHYGGNSPQRGFDCSGLVQYSYGRAGLNLPHGTTQLKRLSKPISSRSLRPGDLLFFDQESKSSSHVAIYVGDDRFVHAPSSGKYVHVGNFASRYWKDHFNEARRLDVD